MSDFDLIIVTAANRAQARGYRAQLAGRKGYLVLPDPGDQRVGSLGATVNALRKMPALGKKARVLVCHSGGDARRTPGYAAMGKAFVPMRDARPLLDHIVDEMRKLPSKPGLTICCGDVIPYLDYAKVAYAKRGVTGVAYPDGPWQAQRHGVYVAGENGEVVDFLQKPHVEKGTFLIDTGILHIDWPTAEKMKQLPIAGDIYEEFPKLLLGGFAAFSVSVVPTCEFFHIGSSEELLKFLAREHNGIKALIDGVAAPLGKLGGDNIITNVPREYGTINLAKGECLTSLPIDKNEWYHLRYRLKDNFKQDGLWEKHGLAEKMKSINYARLLALRGGKCAGVRVTAPVRIDFAGGWSDTPPICNREGGTVVNAAVSLEGKDPIEVVVKPRRDTFIKIVSKDLGKRRLFKTAEEITDRHDPHDWSALVKCALYVTGFQFGSCGLDITISADLPKGSGMGTSSILGAATVAALLGRVDVAEVAELTLRLESEMRTGGGWQDQIGGQVGGVKILRSKPGEQQKIDIRSVDTHRKGFDRILQERGLLYFTGQKRMARNILRKVLAFYAENPHGFAKILVDSLKADAEKCARAIEKGDVDAFVAAVNGYWRDKKLLDPGSTNERVDEIIEKAKPYIDAVTLCGAGGGGFMFLLAKSAADAKKLRRELDRNPPSKWSRFYDFTLNETGLRLEQVKD